MNAQVTAFFEDRIIARGTQDEVTRAVEQGWPNDQGSVRVFDDATGRPVDLDLWDASQGARVLPLAPNAPARPLHHAASRHGPPPLEIQRRTRGRPKLGVTAREVTLLPRQWEWLARQPGGASATLRRLVDKAQKAPAGPEAARDAIYRFITAVAGDRPGYEEALRALYRGEAVRFREVIADWPADVRDYVERWLERLG